MLLKNENLSGAAIFQRITTHRESKMKNFMKNHLKNSKLAELMLNLDK